MLMILVIPTKETFYYLQMILHYTYQIVILNIYI